MGPLVSIVMPTYNVETFVCKTIESVFNQTYQSFELIIIDDCSTDRTMDVVKKFVERSGKVKFRRTRENSGGPARPRNIGLKNCSGDLITFLDADDIWHPQKLEIQLLAVKKYPGNSLFCTSMLDFKNDAAVIHGLYENKKLQDIDCQDLTISMQIRKYRSPLSSLMISREAAKSLDFNESHELAGREDFLFVLQLQNSFGDMKKILLPLVLYRKHSEQISKRKFRMLLAQTSILIDSKKYGLPKNSLLKVLLCVLSHLFLSVYYRVIKGSL